LADRRFIQDAVLLRVWFREGLYRMLFYSGFGSEKVYEYCINLSKPNPE
jgi:hypothetical protein